MEPDTLQMQKIVRVFQEVRIIVVTLTEEGTEREVVVDSIVRPIPVPYEQ